MGGFFVTICDGLSRVEAMTRFGIEDASPLKNRCRLCCVGGAEVLWPKPKGGLRAVDGERIADTAAL